MVQGDFSTLNPTILFFLKLDVFFFIWAPITSLKLYPTQKRLKGNRLCQDIAFPGRFFVFVARVPHKKLLVYSIHIKNQNPNPAWKLHSLNNFHADGVTTRHTCEGRLLG